MKVVDLTEKEGLSVQDRVSRGGGGLLPTHYISTLIYLYIHAKLCRSLESCSVLEITTTINRVTAYPA